MKIARDVSVLCSVLPSVFNFPCVRPERQECAISRFAASAVHRLPLRKTWHDPQDHAPRTCPRPTQPIPRRTGPKLSTRPKNAWPQAPAGFKVELFATGLDEPRKIITAPNGDIFLAESHKGEIKIFRGITADGKPEQTGDLRDAASTGRTALPFILRDRIQNMSMSATPAPWCAFPITTAT